MTSSGAEHIKLQKDIMKLQQRLYISLIPYTTADDKIKMLQHLKRQPNNITAFKQNIAQESSPRRTETVKPGGMSKEDQGKTDQELCTTCNWVTYNRYSGLLEAELNFDRGNGGKNFE